MAYRVKAWEEPMSLFWIPSNIRVQLMNAHLLHIRHSMKKTCEIHSWRRLMQHIKEMLQEKLSAIEERRISVLNVIIEPPLLLNARCGLVKKKLGRNAC